MSSDRLDDIEAAGVRSRDRIISEIRALVKVQGEVARIVRDTPDGDDNLAATDAQIEALIDISVWRF